MSEEKSPEAEEQKDSEQCDCATGRVDPRDVQAYNRYLKDWEWRMSTWAPIRSAQMGWRVDDRD